MKSFKNTLYTVLFFLTVFALQAQNNFILSGTKSKGKIILRWANLNMAQMKQAYTYGYTLQKLNASNLIGAPLNEINVMPFSANAVVFANTQNRYMLTAKKITENIAVIDDAKNTIIDGQLSLIAADLDTNAARAMGLIYSTTVSENVAYQVVIKNGATIIAKSNIMLPKDLKESDAPKIAALKASRNQQRVDIGWTALTAYHHYAIERSEDSTKGFIVANDLPFMKINTKGSKDKAMRNDDRINFKDTTLQEGKMYYYRVQGTTLFGVKGAYSPVLKFKMKRIFKTLIILNDIQIKNGKGLSMAWQLTAPEEEKYISTYTILKREKSKEAWKSIANNIIPPLKSYLDTKVTQQNFHRIAAITLDNDTLFSSEKMSVVYDTIPPQMPQGLSGSIDAEGLLKLTWKANTEADFKGYVVYRSNASHEDLIEINNQFILKPEYQEKLPLTNLTEAIYFAVAAVDKSYNNSGPCKMIQLKKPDKIAPTAALIKDYKATDGQIDLWLFGSSSKDIAAYDIQRRLFSKAKKVVNNYTTIVSLKANDTMHYVDKTCAPFTAYEYKIVSKDDDRNSSESQTYYIQSLGEKSISAEILSLRADTLGANAQKIILTWKANLKPAPKYVLIYKKSGTENFRFYESVDYTKGLFVDVNIFINDFCGYRIQYKYDEEKYSELSKEKVLKIN